MELTITSNTIKGVQFQGERTMDHGTGTYTLNQTNRPAWLDATKPRGNNSQDSWVGIYTLDSDTLKWCVRKKERPTELATKDRAFLLILKRQSSSSAAPVAPSPPVR